MDEGQRREHGPCFQELLVGAAGPGGDVPIDKPLRRHFMGFRAGKGSIITGQAFRAWCWISLLTVTTVVGTRRTALQTSWTRVMLMFPAPGQGT